MTEARPTMPPPPAKPRARFPRLAAPIFLSVACGSAGGQIATKLGSAVAGAASHGGGMPDHPAWSTASGRCDLFGSYQMACPVLPDCLGMDRYQAPTVNACYSGSGLLKPVRVCTDWNQNAYWCASGEFPDCERMIGARCGDFEVVVCSDGPERRVLGCCAASGVDSECKANTYHELRRRSDEAPGQEDAGVGDVATGTELDAGSDAGS